MSLLRDVEWEACNISPVRDPDLERRLRRDLGFVPASVRYYGECPWLVRCLTQFNFLSAKLTHIPLEVAQEIALIVAQDNSCRYCFANARIGMRVMGIPEQVTLRLEQDLLKADLEPAERAVVQFARRLSRANPLLTPRDLEPLQAAGYTDAAIREIALVAANSCAANRLSTFLALPVEMPERLGNGLLGRLVIPVVGWRVRARWGGAEPDYFAAEVGDEPFAPLIVAMEGLPLGRALWAAVNELWNADILPRRTKALVFAVVARALGCRESENEAARLLRLDGFTGNMLEPVLAHLSSQDLDEVEALIVPFARETVWYTPAPIQRRVHALQEHLTLAQTLDMLGTAALANMICRLCVLASMR